MKRANAPGLRRRVSEGVCEIDCVNAAEVEEARRALPGEEVLRSVAEGFKALANPSRLRILKALDGRELCVCDVATLLGLSMSGASQQLRELRRLGAIQYRVEGKLVYYTVADPFWTRLADEVIAKLFPHATAAKPRRKSIPA